MPTLRAKDIIQRQRVVYNLKAKVNKDDTTAAILVQNATGLGFVLHVAGGRTQHQPSTRSILNQNRGLLRQHTKVVI